MVSSTLLKKVITISSSLRILLAILLVGLLVQAFFPTKVVVDAEKITIQDIIKTQIDLKDVVGITERISTKSRRPFYFIDTKQGSYEIDDANFLDKGGDQIIKQVGLTKRIVNEGNISCVYYKPQLDYDHKTLRRAASGPQLLFETYLGTVFTALGLYLMIPFGFCSMHPENFKDVYPVVFPSRNTPEKQISLKLARGLSIAMFLTGLALILFFYATMILL